MLEATMRTSPRKALVSCASAVALLSAGAQAASARTQLLIPGGAETGDQTGWSDAGTVTGNFIEFGRSNAATLSSGIAFASCP